MSPESVIASILADLKKGKSFDCVYDVYGTGRVKISFTYNFAAESFAMKTIEQDMGGSEMVFSAQLNEPQCIEEIRRCLSLL